MPSGKKEAPRTFPLALKLVANAFVTGKWILNKYVLFIFVQF